MCITKPHNWRATTCTAPGHCATGRGVCISVSFDTRSGRGWIYFFTKVPVRTPDDLRKLRLWTAVGYPETEKLSKALGFQVVPLPETDMLTGLQTGLIEAIEVPPLFALLERTYQLATYMTNLKFAPLNAATVINVPAWERIPASYRSPLLEAVRQVGKTLREEILRLAMRPFRKCTNVACRLSTWTNPR